MWLTWLSISADNLALSSSAIQRRPTILARLGGRRLLPVRYRLSALCLVKVAGEEEDSLTISISKLDAAVLKIQGNYFVHRCRCGRCCVDPNPTFHYQ